MSLTVLRVATLAPHLRSVNGLCGLQFRGPGRRAPVIRQNVQTGQLLEMRSDTDINQQNVSPHPRQTASDPVTEAGLGQILQPAQIAEAVDNRQWQWSAGDV